jgi:hypothetical protein
MSATPSRAALRATATRCPTRSRPAGPGWTPRSGWSTPRRWSPWAKTLLETTTGITRLRGRTYPFQGRVLLPTFHPAAALHAQGRRTAGPSPLEAMEDDFRVLAELLAAQAPATEDRPSEQLGLF